MELACQHVSWFRRGLLWRCQIACFVWFVTVVLVATVALHLGYVTPDWLVMLLGTIALATWLGVWMLALPLGDRERGKPGTLILDGTSITLRDHWTRDLASFECGWVTRTDKGIELQRPGGDLLVAQVDDLEAATRWLAATGLDARPLSLRLDDGTDGWMLLGFIYGLAIMKVAGIIASQLFESGAFFDALFLVALTPCFVLIFRAMAMARVVLDQNGVRIRRLLRRTRLVPWSALRSIEEGEEESGGRWILPLTFAQTETQFTIRCGLELFRRGMLLARLRDGISKYGS